MKAMFWTLLAAAGIVSGGAPEPQRDETVVFDKTVHDFGDVSIADGPLSCSFTLTNRGREPVSIYEVVSSCGCTDVSWPRGTIAPGAHASISATYKNEDGPLPFDKSLTVYISGIKRPVVLRLRGVVHERKKSLVQLYGESRLGDLGLKARRFKTGTLKQGLSVSETAPVANLGSRPIHVGWADVSAQLSIRVEPNPIPPGHSATLHFTVRADSSLYGRNCYHATPLINGRKADAALEISAHTQENFSSWNARQRDHAPLPVFTASTCSFGTVRRGETLAIEFACSNKGKTPLHIYKADTEIPALTCVSLPDLAPGAQGHMRFRLDTSALPRGENVIMVSLTTNAPLRPVVNLFVTGVVQ